MSHEFKSILVGLVPDEEDRDRPSQAVPFGIAMSKRFGACLTIHAFVPQMAWVPYSVWSDFPAQLAAAEKQRLRSLAETSVSRARRLAEQDGIACTTDSPELAFDGLTERFNQQTRVHDLTILASGYETLSSHRHVFEEALFNSGHPVIVVPKIGGSVGARTIVVAWDGSARSARAVSDALPMLQGAARISIATVAGEKDLSRMAPGADLAAYLARHGVESTLAVLSAADGNASDALRRHAEDIGADMIVMGAFVHSRLRQSVLGGVTRSLLEDCAVPLFMAY